MTFRNLVATQQPLHGCRGRRLRGRGARNTAAVAVAVALLVAPAAGQPKTPPPIIPPVGGANAPTPSPPPKLVGTFGVLAVGPLAVRVPTGTYTAPAGGAPNHAVPGPIVAFKGADGVWRGHGYVETFPRLLKLEGKLTKTTAELTYAFQGGKAYNVRLEAGRDAILMTETSTLGPRNLYVFDCYYGGWEPAAGFAVNLAGTRHGMLFLPCHYDKAEVTINPAAAEAGKRPRAKVRQTHGSIDVGAAGAAAGAVRPEDRPGGAVVLSGEAGKKDMAGFFCRDLAGWNGADRMGVQLWQRRQLPGAPASRHFLGPETKSDATGNPRTAGMLGKSLYEGHVTIELSLGVGARKLGFAAPAKPADKKAIPEAFQRIMRANR